MFKHPAVFEKNRRERFFAPVPRGWGTGTRRAECRPFSAVRPAARKSPGRTSRCARSPGHRPGSPLDRMPFVEKRFFQLPRGKL